MSRLQTTLALRQGIHSLPDYWLYVNLRPMGIAVSSTVLLSIALSSRPIPDATSGI
ncbi:hypothetical protein H6F84_19630 [Microcoleus sp. FACHB-84]|nr:hypothetical protein [Microcoleus sp. FACHB-84]